MSTILSTDLDDPGSVPYFLWDEPMTVAELEKQIRPLATPESIRLLAKVLREARDTDVWRFVSPDQIARHWDALSPHLGRRRSFWEFLLGRWREEGLIHG